MIRKIIYFLLLVFCKSISAQQFPHYTQYLFNKIGYNPGASGASLAAPFEIVLGGRTQWIGLSNNPKSTFVSFNYNFVPERSFKRWHNVGMYVDQDQNGNFVHNDVWLSYTYHLLVAKNMVLAAGVFAGIKQYRITQQNLDRNDPAVQNSASKTIAYPDIMPGVRLSNKKTFVDFSLPQLTIYNQRGIGGVIGGPSKVRPHYILSLGRKGAANEWNSIVVSMNLKGSFSSLPAIEINMMDYVSKLVGFGFSLRGRNFVSGILQFRLFRKMVVGLAYDLSINKMLWASPNTVEVMIAITPVFNGETIEKPTVRIVDACTF